MTSPFYDSDEFEIHIDEEGDEEEGATAGDIEDDRVTGKEEYDTQDSVERIERPFLLR